MERVAALGQRVLPRGWRHFGIQLVIWFGFYFSYLAVRHLTYSTPGKALVNGLRVISLEQRVSHHLFELTVERIADSSNLLLTAAAWTYWNSEFTVIGLSLLWVYLRRHDLFARFRNSILLANMVGLNHETGLGAFANPYAAMPSLHAADALIVGIFLFRASRNWWSRAIWALW